jgi:hypothetical protein
MRDPSIFLLLIYVCMHLCSQSFIFIYGLKHIYFTWVIIQQCCIYFAGCIFSFDNYDIFDILSCTILHVYMKWVFSNSCYLALHNDLGSLCTFPIPALQLAIPLRSPDPFLILVLESQIWSGVSLPLVSLSWQSQEIYVHALTDRQTDRLI